METVDDVALGVRIGMGSKDWKPTTYDELPSTKKETAKEETWPGKAIVTFSAKGISVR